MTSVRNQLINNFRGSNPRDRALHAHNLFKNDFNLPERFSRSFVTLLNRNEALQQVKHLEIDEELKGVVISSLKDVILLSARAMFLENKKYKSNHTLQNCLVESGFNDEALSMDSVFAEKRFDGSVSSYSFVDAVKLVVDKKIAHRDEIELDGLKEEVELVEAEILDGFNIMIFTSYIFDAHCIYEDVVIKYAERVLVENLI